MIPYTFLDILSSMDILFSIFHETQSLYYTFSGCYPLEKCSVQNVGPRRAVSGRCIICAWVDIHSCDSFPYKRKERKYIEVSRMCWEDVCFMVSLLHGTFIGSNLCDPFIFFHGLMVMTIDKFVNYQKKKTGFAYALPICCSRVLLSIPFPNTIASVKTRWKPLDRPYWLNSCT